MAATTLTDRAVIRLSGEGVRDFLQGLVTSDVAGELPVWAGLLTPQGKCLFDFIVWADGDDLLLDCEAEAADDLIKRLTLYRLRRPDRHRARPVARRPLVARRTTGARSRAFPRLAAAGSAGPDDPAQRLARASPAPRRLRRPRRARRPALARMQCGRIARRQFLQGLLRRPGKHRAHELAAEGQPPPGGRRTTEPARAHVLSTRTSAWRSSTAAWTISAGPSSRAWLAEVLAPQQP